MMVMVDYRCASCAGTSEYLVTAPPPATVACVACHGESRRTFRTAGLVGRAVRTAAPARGGRRPAPGSIECRDNPDVPGLCHLSREAAEVWVARARHDDAALRTAYRKQEQIIEAGGTVSATGAHSHPPAPTVKVTRTASPVA